MSNMEDFINETQKAWEKGKQLKMPKYTKNLRYDQEGVYSYGTKVAELDPVRGTIKSLGKWSVTTSKHYNFARDYLSNYGFREVI